MRKQIVFRGHTFIVSYDFTTEKCPNGKTEHIITISGMDNKLIEYVHKWFTQGKQESIIAKVKSILDEYLEQTEQRKFSYIDEFQNWDGNLDKWDE